MIDLTFFFHLLLTFFFQLSHEFLATDAGNRREKQNDKAQLCFHFCQRHRILLVKWTSHRTFFSITLEHLNSCCVTRLVKEIDNFCILLTINNIKAMKCYVPFTAAVSFMLLRRLNCPAVHEKKIIIIDVKSR